MSQEVQGGAEGTRPHDDYEDDFEKDLDWLISEEAKSSDQEQEYGDIAAELDKELQEEKDRSQLDQDEWQTAEEGERQTEQDKEEERWPSPMSPLGVMPEPEGDPTLLPPPSPDTDADEEKRSILEKIEEANRQLQNQSPPDRTRRRRLHFKHTLVDLVVPPQDYERDIVPQKDAEEQEVSGRLSELQISPRDESRTGPPKEGRVLVEKDGKFDLVSLREVESHGLLPPLDTPPVSFHHSPRSGSFPHLGSAPKPPATPKHRPNSARPAQAAGRRRGSRRRVRSAHNSLTFTLSAEQKEQQARLQQRRERLRREEEERRRAQEEQKRQQNERAFQAWLLRKKDQLQEERRLQRAQEMERKSSEREHSDPHEAFRLWLQRKRQQQEKQRHLETMRRLEEESGYFLHDREECERAYRGWLKRKQAEKRAEKQAARERSRRLVMEARRARRMQDLLCSASESRNLHFTDHYSYRF